MIYVSAWVSHNEAVIAGKMAAVPRVGDHIETPSDLLVYRVDSVTWTLGADPTPGVKELITTATLWVTEIGTMPYPQARQMTTRQVTS